MKGKKYCGSTKDIHIICPACQKKFFFPIGNYPIQHLEEFKKHGPLDVSCPWCWDYPRRGSNSFVEIDLNDPKPFYGS